MKRIILCLIGALPLLSFAQKRPLDHTVYDGWQQNTNVQISENGNFASYIVTPQEGDNTLYIHNLKRGNNTQINRGYGYFVTPNEQFAVGKIKHTFQQIKAFKKKKKKKIGEVLKDTLFITNLSTFKTEHLGEINSFKIGQKGSNYLAFSPKDTIYGKDSVVLYKPLIIQELKSNWRDTIANVESYTFDENGDLLALLIAPKKNKKDSIPPIKELSLYDIKAKKQHSISKGFFKYNNPTFDKEGTQLAFLAAKDTILSTNKCFELYLYNTIDNQLKTLIDTNYSKDIPNNWHFTANSKVSFAENGKKLFTSIAPLTLPQDTITDKEEQAALDLWHYKDLTIQPYQLKNRETDLKRTYTAIIDLEKSPSNLILITPNQYERIYYYDKRGGDFAILADPTPYLIASQWSVSTGYDIYKLDYKTQKREPLFTNFIGSFMLSPKGNYLLMYNKEDLNWYSYSINTKRLINLTGDLDVVFWDEENDTPSEPYPYGVGAWIDGDKEVMLYDANDIWKFNLESGKAVCVTNHNGRDKDLKYRIIKVDSEKQYYEKSEKLLLSVFNTKTKDESLASIKIDEVKAPKLYFKAEPYDYEVLGKAKNSDVFIYTKSNFTTCPDVWVTKNFWKTATQLSHINPQMSEYNWGSVELVSWNAFDGQKLNGLLYKPEDFDPNKKYPMMIYFYETHSDELNQYYSPSPSWSIINIPFYVSRGYLVFCPDIKYTAGLPGESAYNCIVSGAKAMAKNSWVDEKNMAIQGQSWGGYQVAYLVTRTNMFKAAGAGAPVSNMTSAYGGIRWSTGTSRQLQYEMGQSRIGSTLWEAPELYIANSPLFKADRIQTPLLIMHNDNDGAVPWYQGIELFMALRRLQKPVWMMQYNNEEHNLRNRVNRKDLSIRLQQFFDHYLKGDPAPEWMVNGLPAVKKGKTMGYDLVK